jgi:beta-glucanase (GH16 family)
VPGVLHPTGDPAFVADFSGSSLDTSVWDTCYPWASQSGCTNYGNAGLEDEWYMPSQVQVFGGELHLIAQQVPVVGQSSTGSPQDYACRSGMVTSEPGFRFQYGYIQIVAQIPTGSGLWPALWLDPANGQWPPEMDILEAYGGPPFGGYTYFHYATAAGDQYTEAQILPDPIGWHTFALSWTSTQMTWLVDGHVIQTVTQNVPQQEMFFIADLAEQGSSQNPTLAPGQCNGSLNISSVSWWPA